MVHGGNSFLFAFFIDFGVLYILYVCGGGRGLGDELKRYHNQRFYLIYYFLGSDSWEIYIYIYIGFSLLKSILGKKKKKTQSPESLQKETSNSLRVGFLF